jgi:hypothetical protein
MWRGIVLEYRRLPPFLRLATTLGLLCFLTSFVLAGWMLARGFVSDSAGWGGSWRIGTIAEGLLALGVACTFLSIAYRSHVRSPDTVRFPFASWQQQARITALFAALPIGSIVLTLVGPPSPFAHIAPVVLLLALPVNLVAITWAASLSVDPPAWPSSPES